MKMHKHTPGPLEARPELSSELDGLYMVVDLAAPEGVEACTASYCTKADATLYAAAPELLEALDPIALEAVADALTEKRHVDRARMLREIARRQRAAIAKAEA